MPTITEFSGEKLLESAVVAEIKSQTEILLKNKDVAGAFRSAAHLKTELAKLPADKVKPVLDSFRAITANLKVLALPLLEKEEVKNLLANNLAFLSPAYADGLASSLSAWFSIQPEPDKVREDVLAALPADNPLSEKIKAMLLSPLPILSGSPVKTSNSSTSAGQAKPAPPPDTVSGKKDDLFDEDEEAELRTHAAKIGELGHSPLPIDSASSLADEMLKQCLPRTGYGVQHDGRQVQDADSFKRRAQALVVSRLRDVRTAAEIRDYLSRPFAVGGLGLSGEPLEKALKLIEQEYQKLHSQVSQVISNKEKVISKTAFPASSPSNPSVSETPAVSAVSTPAAPALTPVEAVLPAPKVPATQTPPIPSFTPPPPTPPSSPTPAPIPPPPRPMPRIMRNIGESATDKPRLDDIKRPATDIALPFGGKGPVPTGRLNVGFGNAGTGTVGAPDEFKLITLADWRKWGGGDKAAAHLLGELNILAKESLSEKLEAISAWRGSRLFADYVNIGRSALSAGRKLAESLADAAVNPNKMTEEEFFAIAELNGKLK